jgi:hypothetical protein
MTQMTQDEKIKVELAFQVKEQQIQELKLQNMQLLSQY